MKLKRLRNRTLGVVLGLGLGWWAAGYLPSSLSGAGHPVSPEAEGHAPAAEVEATGGESVAHPPSPAEKLVPQEEVNWYRPVLAAVGGLFAAAVVIGIPVLQYQGKHPVVEADAHDAHDAHGKDEQAAGHGGGHH